MIKGLVAIGYKDIFDDYDQIDPKQLLEGVPTKGALDMVVFYQNKTIFAFADLEMHRQIDARGTGQWHQFKLNARGTGQWHQLKLRV